MIYLTIEGQEMAGILTAPLVSGQVNFVDVKTIFDSTWDDLNKSYQFRNGDTVSEVDSNDEIINLPYEATAYSGTLEINVVGTKLDDDGVTVLKKATTNTLRFKVGCCNLDDNPDNCGEVSATVVEQIRQIAETAEDKASEAERISALIWEAYRSGELNGKDGKDGRDGRNGVDGVSPTFETKQVDGGAEITLKDVNGSQVVFLEDGPQGEQGPRGESGPRGERGLTGSSGANGKDGVSPTVTTTQTSTGATITIKDATGTHKVELLNGKDGKDGDGGGITEETDPTVPSWAKQSSKPSYTKYEVGLGSVDNVKQYSVDNPPPYPVKSVNGKTGAVVVDVPTKTSELTNDSKFATTDYVDNEIATFDFIKVVDSLPSTGLANRIYFVPKSDTETQDLFDEYAWINGAWEYITTKQIEVDLTNYATRDDLSSKQDTLTSGTNIKTINGESVLGFGDITIEGGTGGGSSYKEVDLISAPVLFNITKGRDWNVLNTNIDFNESLDDFDEVSLVIELGNNNGYYHTKFLTIKTSNIIYNDSETTVYDGSHMQLPFGTQSFYCALGGWFKTPTRFWAVNIGTYNIPDNTVAYPKVRIHSIKGIKY